MKLGLIAGDGIGKEVMVAAHRVLQKFGPKYQVQYLEAGFECFQRTGTALPQETVQQVKQLDGALFGAVSSPSVRVKGYSSPIVQLRIELDLYANVRPLQAANLDMVVYRENTECLYIKREREYTGDDGLRQAIAERLITEKASRRIGRLAYLGALKRAQQNGSSSLTIVHKSNVLSVTDGLFRESIHDEIKKIQQELGGSSLSEYIAKVPVQEQLVDSAVYKLFYNRMHKPDSREFDVMVAPNMYGDIISDAGAALVGSLGLVPGANVGDEFCLGEPVHGSAPDIAVKLSSNDLSSTQVQDQLIEQSQANPIAMIRSLALLLRELKQVEDAQVIEQAVNRVLEDPSKLTRDIGGNGRLNDVLRLVLAEIGISNV